MIAFSKHGAHRGQKRSVPPAVVEWLYDFGTPYAAGCGAEKLVFDKAARRRLERMLGGQIFSKVEEYLGAYAIRSSNGEVVTCGWLTEHIRR
ncbi:MAG TPA: hypothetical protein VMB71_00890 [Acetobacteraceae bacterium]|nr:hypothetical protein [Acetobacteraceae bacterium]